MNNAIITPSRNTSGILAGLSLILVTSCMQQAGQSRENTNIILIIADDLGYNDLNFYRDMHKAGALTPPTCQNPYIDKLAGQGIAFTIFYGGAAVCSPSRAALLTSRNATRVGIYNFIPKNSPMHLRSKEITMAKMLKQQNYHTAHFCKWHLTHLTSDFDTQPGSLQQGYDYAFFTQNNAEPSHHNPVNFIRNGNELGIMELHNYHLMVDEALDWVSNQKESENPFNINIWFHEPHVVCAAPGKFTSRHSYHQDYYGSIEKIDAAVGKLMDYPDQQGMNENALVIFTSDNGSQELYSNLPLIGRKELNLEGSVKIPFIARWTETLTSGFVSSATGSFTDILPTFAELTGAMVPEDRIIDGVSLLTVLKNPRASFKREKPIFFYRYFHDPICVLRQKDWLLRGYKELIDYSHNLSTWDHAKFKPAEGEPRWSQWGFQKAHQDMIPAREPFFYKLHHVRNDPGQTQNLADKYPEKVEQMTRTMLSLRKEMIEEGGNWSEN